MAAVAAVAALAFGYFMVNLGAAKSPVANTRGLPVAIVDRDAGAVVGGERMGVGGDMVDEATASEKIGDKVEWTRLDSRSEAARGISEGRYYGALVIPEDLSEKVGELSGGPEVPVAIANQDRGATMAGRDVEFGERVVGSVTDDPALEGVVRWTEVADAGRALKGMEDGEYAGAIVVPEDYSERLAGLAVTPTGETPRPARLELLTNPAVDSPTAGLLRQVYGGIVRETSATTGAEITGPLARAKRERAGGAGAAPWRPGAPGDPGGASSGRGHSTANRRRRARPRGDPDQPLGGPVRHRRGGGDTFGRGGRRVRRRERSDNRRADGQRGAGLAGARRGPRGAGARGDHRLPAPRREFGAGASRPST